MHLFNFHTHNTSEVLGIINLDSGYIIEKNKQYSIGIHPWDYSYNSELQFDEISEIASLPSVIAIGETGFDPKSKLNIDQQIQIFSKHIELSERIQKPLIIHCVKFFNELENLIKTINPKQAWIIHGFRGKITVLENLVKHGFYFSINEEILKDVEKAEKIFTIISPEKLFFETDDNNTDIKNIYNFAARVLNIEIAELVNIIDKNLERCKIQTGRKEQNSF